MGLPLPPGYESGYRVEKPSGDNELVPNVSGIYKYVTLYNGAPYFQCTIDGTDWQLWGKTDKDLNVLYWVVNDDFGTEETTYRWVSTSLDSFDFQPQGIFIPAGLAEGVAIVSRKSSASVARRAASVLLGT